MVTPGPHEPETASTDSAAKTDFENPILDQLPEQYRSVPNTWPVWKRVAIGTIAGALLVAVYMLTAWLLGRSPPRKEPLTLHEAIYWILGIICASAIASFVLAIKEGTKIVDVAQDNSPAPSILPAESTSLETQRWIPEDPA